MDRASPGGISGFLHVPQPLSRALLRDWNHSSFGIATAAALSLAIDRTVQIALGGSPSAKNLGLTTEAAAAACLATRE